MWRQRVSSHYLSGPLPYVRRHITVNKNVSRASLNETFHSFLVRVGATIGPTRQQRGALLKLGHGFVQIILSLILTGGYILRY